MKTPAHLGRVLWRLALFAAAAALSTPLLLAQPGSDTPSTTALTKDSSGNLTSDIAIGAGKTLTLSGALQGTPTGGTLDLSALTLSLPAALQIPSQTGNADSFLFTNGSALSWLNYLRDADGALSLDYLSRTLNDATETTALNWGTRALSGTWTAPTAAPDTSTTQIATTAFAKAEADAAQSASQPLDTDLTSWAGVTRASGFDTFTATPSSANLRALLTDETGTGIAYFVGGALGTPSSGTLTNATGLPVSTGISGLGTGVATALAVNTGSAGAVVVNGGALGTPSSGTINNVVTVDDGALSSLDFQIVNHGKLRAALAAARTHRVAVIGVGDSNMSFGGTGFVYYLGQALYRAYGCWGTGVMWGDGTRNTAARAQALSSFVTTGAPSELTVSSPRYQYLPEATSTTVTSTNSGVQTNGVHPIDTRGNLLVRMRLATFPSGSSSYTPRVRKSLTPFTTVVNGTEFTPNTGSYGFVDYTINVAADPTRLAWGLVVTPAPINATIEGPYFLAWAAIENEDKSTGLAWSTFFAEGGASARGMLNGIDGYGSTAREEYFRAILLGLTGARKTAVVIINAGFNDRNETLTSLGPSPVADGDSPEAFADNLQGIISAIETSWVAAGGESTELHFCFLVSHPISNPDDSELVQYRRAAAKLARSLSNASSVSIPNVRSYEDFVAGEWYDGSGVTHLTTAGYEHLSNAIVRAVATRDDTQPVTASGTLDFGSVSSQAAADLSIYCPGAVVGKSVKLGLPASPAAGIVFSAFVSATDVVTVRAFNITGDAVDPDSATYTVTVDQ